MYEIEGIRLSGVRWMRAQHRGELVDQFSHRNAAVRRYFLPGDRNWAVGDKTDVLLRRPGIGFPASGGPLFDAGIVVEDRDSLMAHLPTVHETVNHGM